MTQTAASRALSPAVRAVCDWYHLPPQFVDAVLETFLGADYDRRAANLQALYARYPAHVVQLEYSFSANDRGRNLANHLSAWRVNLEEPGQSGKTFLDIGCAYGGFLVAFARRGFAVTGIEISEKFARFGRLNLEGNGFPANILLADFLAADVLPGEQQFDVITCNDVIEHVSDPAACIAKISRLLKPGGAAYVASPNKLGIPNVRADVHFQRFGLNLLDYFRARAAYTMYSDYPHYEVSDFYEPEWYINTARLAGVHAQAVYESPARPEDIPGEIAQLYAAFADWAREGSRKLDPFMRHEITRELGAYSERMFRDYTGHVTHNSLDRFYRRWIDSPTRILMRKAPF